MNKVKFTEIKHNSKEGYWLLDKYEQEYTSGTADRVVNFVNRFNF